MAVADSAADFLELAPLALVRYPSRAAFLRMVKSDAYQAIMPHRTAALADSRLIELRAGALPAWLLRGAGAVVRARAVGFPKVR